MALSKDQIKEYLSSTKKILLSTVTDENKPDIRILGGFATDGFKLYFSSLRNSRKVSQIEANPHVAVYFEAPISNFLTILMQRYMGKQKK